MIRLTTHLLLMAAMLISAGCSLAVKPGPSAIHDLGPRDRSHEAIGPGWSVGALDAPVWLWDERIRYRLLYDDATLVRFYSLDRWEAPPPAMLEQRLSNAGERPDFTLQIRLKQFEQQFDAPGRARVIMSFDVEARTRKDQRIVGERNFKLQRMTVTADAPGAIESFIALSDQAVAEIRTWLAALAVSAIKRAGWRVKNPPAKRVDSLL
jgi:cholesterol transport system auxiliary component